MTTLINKSIGCIYGQALGDAWAMPAMFTPDQTWERFGGYITSFLPGPADHFVHSGLPAGKVTDDTEQAMALAESILADGKVTAEGAARAIVAWYDRIGGDTCPFVGPSTRRAVLAIKRGADIAVTGAHGDTNGASMRISVVGVLHPGKPLDVIDDVAQACLPTHNTDVAVSGASAIAGAVADALREGATLDSIIDSAKAAARLGRKRGNQWMGASVDIRIDMAVSIARSGKPERQRLQELYDVVGATLAISESVPAAFGVLAMANGDPKQCAIYAAALSGDADTIGAMACAIAGAWRGVDAFEPALLRTLDAANPEFDFTATAKNLAALAQS